MSERFPLSVVVPLFNEAKRFSRLTSALRLFFAKAPEYFSSVEIILVDDGSVDDTTKLISELVHHQDPGFGTIHGEQLAKNQGKGAALRHGVLRSKGAWVLTMDADVATDPDELVRWINIGRFKPEMDRIVHIASREHPESHVYDHTSRRMMGRVFNFLTRCIAGLGLKDTQCGFKLYPGPAARREFFGKLRTMGWAHDVELLLRAQDAGYTIIEQPVTWHAIEDSRVRPLRDAWRMFWELWRIRIVLWTERRGS